MGLCANEPSPLPSPFLTPPEFSRCSCAHANVEQLRKDAPRAFLEPPSKTDGFSPSITLRGDFRQELARGKEAYLRAFDAIARFNTSPLVPLKAGELRASFEPGFEQVCVQWNTTVRPVGMQQASPSAEFSFSGLSTYKIDEDGAFSEQFISDLRVNGRRLPSSEFGSWLNLLEQRSATSPVVGLSLLFNTVSGAPAPPVSTSKSLPSNPPPFSAVPPPGSRDWPKYALFHEQAQGSASSCPVLSSHRVAT